MFLKIIENSQAPGVKYLLSQYVRGERQWDGKFKCDVGLKQNNLLKLSIRNNPKTWVVKSQPSIKKERY